MPRQPLNLHNLIRSVPEHVAELSPEAHVPIEHFEEMVNVGLALLKYLDDHIDSASVYQNVYERHLGHLRRMVLAELIESFERFLKEIATICIDYLAPYTVDDRLNKFLPKRGDQIAIWRTANSIGKALCESDTWLNNSATNERFSLLLKSMNGGNWECLFPASNEQPPAQRQNASTLAVLWQIRHDLTHNVGVLTHSDAMKLRILTGRPVPADRRLSPTVDDLRYVKRFLSELADSTNQRVGQRLAVILTELQTASPGLFPVQDIANAVSRHFAFSVTIAGTVGVA